MAVDCNNISHPLTFQPGVSMQNRIDGSPDPGKVKIDGRTLADFLKFIEDFSQQVNHYDSQLNIGDWKPFFTGNAPFVIARIASVDPGIIQEDYKQLITDLLTDHNPALIQWVIDFLYNEVIYPWNQWHIELSGQENYLQKNLTKIIRSNLSLQLKSFIAIINGINEHFDIVKPDFQPFESNDIWDLEVIDQIVVDDTFIHAPGGVAGRLEALVQLLEGIFEAFQENLRIITDEASVENFLTEENILENGNSKNNPAHLALIYTFFRLYKTFQENTNKLSKNHLDFFYREVLCLREKDPVPDEVHVIFELQKFVEKKLLEADTNLKDGKDNLKKDVFFTLDEDIVVNKAQVKSIKTQFLHLTDYYDGTTFIENLIQGVYTAPIANSKDGLGEPFGEEDSGSWDTLGARYSKLKLPDKILNSQHPFGRLGFVLASPVLLLNEGLRKITIELELTPTNNLSRISELDYMKLKDILKKEFYFITAETVEIAKKTGLTDPAIAWIDDLLKVGNEVNIGENTDLITTHPDLTPSDHAAIISGLDIRRVFKISLSGEKEWIIPPSFECEITHPGSYILTFVIELNPDIPAVTFFNSEVLEEELDTTLPLVKIEIDQSVPVICPSLLFDPECCLKKCIPAGEVEISVYEYFKGLKITDSEICVEVCGMKNVIVQNDENVIDINSLIMPFGSLPKVNANFYIGSREIFCKPWNEVWISVVWKDKPADLEEHYKHYILEGGATVMNDSFEIQPAVLHKGDWKGTAQPNKILFQSADPRDAACAGKGINVPDNIYQFQRSDFINYVYAPGKDISHSDEALSISTMDGFLRLQLQGMGFHHDIFPYVLARHMMALADLVDPLTIAEVRLKLDDAENRGENIDQHVEDLITRIQSELVALAPPPPGSTIADYILLINGIIEDFDPAKGDLNELETKAENLKDLITEVISLLTPSQELKDGLPKEPYTPIIKEIVLDYNACATEADIHLRHLGVFEKTYITKDITHDPTMLPVIEEEGALFLGIEQLIPGSNLNILYQLAETTANSESDVASLEWYYLRSNRWIPLRNGFEILDDDTEGLTRSGIVKIAIPRDISLKGHTVMPDNLAWLKVGTRENAGAVAETIGIHTQAVKATFSLQKENDPSRLSAPLAADQISKLAIADAAVKKVGQPYESFNGRLSSDHYYRSVSELLHHRGRAIAAFDYERIVMDFFDEVHLAKCIQHTIGLSADEYLVDLELAPGNVLLAVIADITRLPYKERFAPQLPLSKLNRIEEYLSDKHSPFARIKTSNPRYEKVHAGMRVVLRRGRDENYFREQLIKELILFFSPWVEGEVDQLVFGRSITLSSVLQFIENREYVDYVLELQLRHDEDKNERCLTTPIDLCNCDQENGRKTSMEEIHPLTARSILVAGEIRVEICPLKCIEQDGDCDGSVPFHKCENDQNGTIIR